MKHLRKITNFLKEKFGWKSKPVINYVRLEGQIGTSRNSLNLNRIYSSLEEAFNIHNTEGRDPIAVCLIINSPGGSPVQSNLISKALKQLQKEKENIPLYSFAEDIAASGGYMILSAAASCYADRYSILGSIGVISFGWGLKPKSFVSDTLGVEPRIQTSGSNKFRNNPFEPWKEEDQLFKKKILTKLHDNFIQDVKSNRGDRLPFDDDDKMKEIFSGDVFTAEDSVKLGLIDGFGDMRNVMKDHYGENIEFKKIDKKRSIFQLLSQGPFETTSLQSSFSASLEKIFNPNTSRFL